MRPGTVVSCFVFLLTVAWFSLSFLGCWKCEGHVTSAEGQTFDDKEWRHEGINGCFNSVFTELFILFKVFDIKCPQINIVVQW